MKKRSDERSRNSETSSVKDAINALLDAYRIRGRFDESKLITSWGTLMGKPIARRTEKLFIRDKILYVKVNSAPLRNELNMAKVKVLEIIQKEFGKDLILDVIFS